MNCGNPNFIYPGMNVGGGGPGHQQQPRNQVMTQQIALPPQPANFGAGQGLGAQMSMQQLGQGATGMPNFMPLGNMGNISAMSPNQPQPFGGQFGAMAGQLGASAGGFSLNQMGTAGLGAPLGLTQLGGLGGQGMGQFPMLSMGGQMPPQQAMMHQMHDITGNADFAHQLNLNAAFHSGLAGQQGQPGQQQMQQMAPSMQTMQNMQKMNTSNGLLNMFRKA